MRDSSYQKVPPPIFICLPSILQGMMINIPTYVIHHNPEYWPEPELFKPERFLKENADQIVPYSWLPFGAGPRACIGERFAMAEMKMALAKVVSKFRVEADEMTKIEFQKGDQAMMSYHGVYVRMVPRSSSRRATRP